MPQTRSTLTPLLDLDRVVLPPTAHVMTAVVDLPPGDRGTPPHRHDGPVFGYVLEGALLFELDGAPARVIVAGEAFWEPGGEVIHWRAANDLPDRPTRFVAVMTAAPGADMLTLLDAEELEHDPRHSRLDVAASSGR